MFTVYRDEKIVNWLKCKKIKLVSTFRLQGQPYKHYDTHDNIMQRQ